MVTFFDCRSFALSAWLQSGIAAFMRAISPAFVSTYFLNIIKLK